MCYSAQATVTKCRRLGGVNSGHISFSQCERSQLEGPFPGEGSLPGVQMAAFSLVIAWQRERTLSCPFFKRREPHPKGLTLRTSSKLNCLPKALLKIPSYWELGFRRCIWGEHNSVRNNMCLLMLISPGQKTSRCRELGVPALFNKWLPP